MLRIVRNLSFKNTIAISSEVRQALNDKVPVVSLESTIITHGFPYPANIDMALAVEQKIRDNGCVPATCAFIKGQPTVGLTGDQLQYLAEQKHVNKVSRRDIGVTMSQKLNGGTTIAGTMILSHLSSIKVFATGGLGGVHRDGHITMDVSTDLTELSRTPVTVVCAGPKLILDIPRTMEYLETQGVLVGTYNDNGRTHVEVPGFFCRESGVKSPYSFSSWQEIASLIHNQNNLMGLDSGSLICIPPLIDSALPADFICEIIDSANKEAMELKISGKDLTPFLLQKIAKDTKGMSVQCNKEFVIQNAEAASRIAVELMELERGKVCHRSELTNMPTEQQLSFQPSTALAKKVTEFPNVVESKRTSLRETVPVLDQVDTIIIGLIAVDTIGKCASKAVMRDSNPGQMKSSIGGVGYNVYLAHKSGLLEQGFSSSYRLVAAIGSDFAGKAILEDLSSSGEDTSGIFILENGETAQYTAILDPSGELIVAAADMAIMEDSAWMSHISKQIIRAQPRNVIIDCNVLPEIFNHVISVSKKVSPFPKLIVEPTSQPKLGRIGRLGSKNLRVFPNNFILLITPTSKELEAIFSSFNSQGYFDNFDEWFPALDALGIDANFREAMTALAKKHKVMATLLQQGLLQQAFQLLPYIPNILLKLGAEGCVLIRLSTDARSYKSVPTTSPYKPAFTITSVGKILDGDKQMGVVVQHFSIPSENEDLDIVDVTGAGDSLLGYLTSGIIRNDWLGSEIESLEQEWGLWESIYKAQLASGQALSKIK